jgi:ribose-phosphate pyrophosphokinase
LEVVANLINSCGFEKVVLFDVHSDVATVAIKNSINITNRELVDKYDLPNSIIICPDAGAVKKIGKYLEWNDNIVDVVYCTKSRDLSNGNLTIKVLEPEKCKDRNCVIIDDLCDGGGTFIGIANQIEPKHLTLIISHGIFSKGIMGLKEKFNKVIVSNSYAHSYDDKLIKTINIF